MGTYVSLHGRRFGIDSETGALRNAAGLQLNSPCVDATITVGAEDTGVRAITIHLKDAAGRDINYVETAEIIVFSSAAMTAFAGTGGTTGIAIGAEGALLPIVAKKYFLATSAADGVIGLTWTDAGSESVAIGVRLPNGCVVVSEAFANA